MMAVIGKALSALRRVFRTTVKWIFAPFAFAGDVLSGMFRRQVVTEEEVVQETVDAPAENAAVDAAAEAREVKIAKAIQQAAALKGGGCEWKDVVEFYPTERSWLASLSDADNRIVSKLPLKTLAGHLAGRRLVPGLRGVERAVYREAPPALLPAADPATREEPEAWSQMPKNPEVLSIAKMLLDGLTGRGIYPKDLDPVWREAHRRHDRQRRAAVSA